MNSYVIYKQTMLAAGKHPIRHLAFRQKLITQLIGGFSNRKRAGRRGAEAPVIEESQFPGHTLIKAAKRVCKNCSQLGNKTTGGGRVQTYFKCQLRNVHLCQGGCLIAYYGDARHMDR